MFDSELNMYRSGTNGNGESRDRILYAPLDVESGSKTELNHSNLRGCVGSGKSGVESTGNNEISLTNSKNSVSAADVLKTTCFILVWYTFSLFLTLYNKSLLGDHLGKFPAPFLLNTFHFAMQAILSKAITWFWSERFEAGITISWRDYFTRVVPTAFATALDIDLSNESLVFISVTFATMEYCCICTLWVCYFLWFLDIIRLTCKLVNDIEKVVAKETEFEFWGFIFVMLAAVMSGFRWCMIQILLQRETSGLKNPLIFMSYVTPFMALATALFSLLLDPWHEFSKNNYFNSTWNIARSCLLMLFGGTLAFFMVLTEYVLISVTSAVTVTIAGVVKEALTIIVAVFYFHDEFTRMKGVGLLITMIGVGLFNWFKYQKLPKGQTSEDDIDRLSATNITSKYATLDQNDEQDDGI